MQKTRLLLMPQVWPHRQAEHFPGHLFGNRKSPGLFVAVSIGRLQMRRDRIVDHRADPRSGEGLLQGIALGRADYKEVPDRFGPFRHFRQDEPGKSGKIAQVVGGNLPTALIPCIEPGQLDPQQRRLQFIETGIETDHVVAILDL